jgi:hypothetical protein
LQNADQKSPKSLKRTDSFLETAPVKRKRFEILSDRQQGPKLWQPYVAGGTPPVKAIIEEENRAPEMDEHEILQVNPSTCFLRPHRPVCNKNFI